MPLGALGLTKDGGIGLDTGATPGRDLLRIQPLTPAIGTEFLGVEVSGLDDDGELCGAVARVGGRRRDEVATRLERLGAPAIEGITRDLGLPRQVGYGPIVRRQHLGDEAGFELGGILSHGQNVSMTVPRGRAELTYRVRGAEAPSAHRTVRTGPYTAPHARRIHRSASNQWCSFLSEQMACPITAMNQSVGYALVTAQVLDKA